MIECNFNSDIPNQKHSSDVSYIKCKDGTLYISAIVNTDQGAVYFAYGYVEFANNMGFTRSMYCWENRPIENWFMQLKHE